MCNYALHSLNSLSKFSACMLSVIIITKNESSNIRRCLNSITWADEIVIVDSGSEDDTLKICEEFNCRIERSDWPGFGPQKNKALDLASGDWILSIDADEEVTPALQQEIQTLLQNESTAAAWEIDRKSNYCGKFLNHSGWSPDYVLRLFQKNVGRFSNDIVHERILIKDPRIKIARLKSSLLHYPMPGFEQAIDKMNLYSTLSANDKFKRGERSSLFKAIARGFWTFFRVLILQRGFLDGKHGFMLAISNAGGTYYKYVKLSHLYDSDQQK